MEKSWDIFPKYVNVINEYLTHYTSNKKFKNQDNDYLYLLQNGFSTLTHIFLITLRENLDVTEAIENTKKGIIYYTEFIEKIEENSMHDLNISSVNATTFTIKKTISYITINNKNTEEENTEEENTYKTIKNLNKLTLLYRDIFNYLIHNGFSSVIIVQLTNIAIGMCSYGDLDIEYDENKMNEDIMETQINNIMIFINHFPQINNNKFFYNKHIHEYIRIYVKKYKHIKISLDGLYLKKINKNFENMLYNQSVTNYIKWLIL
jgi:hypothetical protein